MATHIHFQPENLSAFSIGARGPRGPAGLRGLTGPKGNVGARGTINLALSTMQDLYLAAGPQGLYYSSNTSNWTRNFNANIGVINSLAYGDNQWVAVGANQGPTIHVSTDGYNWTPANVSLGCYGVAYGDNKWVAVGRPDGNGQSSIQVSTDGYTWTPSSNGGFSGDNNGYAVAYGSNKWVAVGTGPSSIQVSTDGYNWTPASNGLFSSSIGVAYADNRWVVVGNGTSSIKVSTDGYNWTNATTEGATYRYGGVAYGSGLWVAVGSGNYNPENIQISLDASNWYYPAIGRFENYGNAVAYGSDRWIAVGEGSNSILVSKDGNFWSSKNTYPNVDFNCVAYGKGELTTKVSTGTININTLNDIPVIHLQEMHRQWVANGGDFY